MRFISTRGKDSVVSSEAVKCVISVSGGVYVPEKLPLLTETEIDEMLSEDFAARTVRIFKKFYSELDEKTLGKTLTEEFSEFEGGDPAPLVRVDDGVYMLELFHGPSCSSKDITAAIALPVLQKYISGKKSIAVATSGDLGKAIIERFKDRDDFAVQAFYPVDGLSKMQKLQITAQTGSGVSVVAVKGDYNDCLDGVLASSSVCVNSANFISIVSGIVCVFSAYLDLLSSEQIVSGEEVDFYIPAGNLENVLAAYYAKCMGLPIRRIHCAANENTQLVRFFSEGIFKRPAAPVKSTSPSMDICVPSELERLIFEISGRDAALTAERMQKLDGFTLTDEEKAKLKDIFDCGSADEETCVEAMYDVFIDAGYTMDTCTGCAMKVAQDWYEKNKKDETKAVIVAINSPYKFPQDVLYAVTGNDVKDSFKGVKRLHDATAMAVPKCIKELRDKPVAFTKVIEKGGIGDEIKAFTAQK